MVENDLDCRFQELEEVVVRMTQLEKDTIPKLRVKEDIFKTVNIDAWEALHSCQSERSSKSSHIDSTLEGCLDSCLSQSNLQLLDKGNVNP